MHETHGTHQEEAARVPPVHGLGEDISPLDPADFEPREFQLPAPRRTLTVLFLLLAFGLAILLPPLLNVNRFRRQIASSISSSLGRPVHMDTVALNLLPVPSFTLENFVVGEDPSFGSEPVIHANSVQARLRIRSLWRRRVEFSRISLTDASVNLVHRADGRWNIEGILLQASRLQVAPTEQKAGGSAPRFPYIEATNARVNVKMGLEKMPLALTETEFALWLPKPDQWRLRLVGRPSRTDNAATDTGLLRIQGTLGKADALPDVPVELAAEWSGAPLGAVSWVLLGRDADFRGDMTLSATVAGTMGQNLLSTRLSLRGARRADFVPVRSLDIDIACKARAAGVFHHLDRLQCEAPADVPKPFLEAEGVIADCLHPDPTGLRVKIQQMDAARLLDGLRLASPRVAPTLRLAGSVSGDLALRPLAGEFNLQSAQLALGPNKPMLDSDLPVKVAGERLDFGPVPLELGGDATLTGHADRTGYSLHLAGTVLRSRLLTLAAALPQFGDGLDTALPQLPAATANPEETPEAPLHLDLISSRPWSGDQTWTSISPRQPVARRGRRGSRSVR